MKTRFLFLIQLLCSTFLFAGPAMKKTIPADTSNPFQPRFAVHIAPLAAVDLLGGTNLRAGFEYRIHGRLNGMTEPGIYFGSLNNYKASGYRVRQDLRIYTPGKRSFFGLSVMYKHYGIEDRVGFHTDTITYGKNFTLQKDIIAPSVLIGSRFLFGK